MKKTQLRLFFMLVAGFILVTVIGTVSHEGGHYAVAKYLGYPASIHYGYTEYGSYPHNSVIDSFYEKNETAIFNGADFQGKENFEALIHQRETDALKITAGGPLQTMLVGTIGFCLLIIYREKIFAQTALKFRQWILVFLSLFWLRQVFNAAGAVLFTLAGKDLSRSEMPGDELKLSLFYHLPILTVDIITGAAGMIISCIVIFKFIPQPQRTTFIFAGLTGGISGFILWMNWLGPILMP